MSELDLEAIEALAAALECTDPARAPMLALLAGVHQLQSEIESIGRSLRDANDVASECEANNAKLRLVVVAARLLWRQSPDQSDWYDYTRLLGMTLAALDEEQT